MSRGTNSRLPFGVNVNLNLSNINRNTGQKSHSVNSSCQSSTNTSNFLQSIFCKSVVTFRLFKRPLIRHEFSFMFMYFNTYFTRMTKDNISERKIIFFYLVGKYPGGY